MGLWSTWMPLLVAFAVILAVWGASIFASTWRIVRLRWRTTIACYRVDVIEASSDRTVLGAVDLRLAALGFVPVSTFACDPLVQRSDARP
jgi:hypothetical protein